MNQKCYMEGVDEDSRIPGYALLLIGLDRKLRKRAELRPCSRICLLSPLHLLLKSVTSPTREAIQSQPLPPSEASTSTSLFLSHLLLMMPGKGHSMTRNNSQELMDTLNIFVGRGVLPGFAKVLTKGPRREHSLLPRRVHHIRKRGQPCDITGLRGKMGGEREVQDGMSGM